MRDFDQIMFEVRVNNLEQDVRDFSRWVSVDEPEDRYGGYIYQAWCVTAKSEGGDEEVPATRGTRRPANHAKRRKATEHQKRQLGAKYRFSAEPIDAYWIEEIRDDNDNVRKVTHWLFDTHKEVAGMTTEEYYEFLKSIPWSKVKACNVKQSWGGKSLSKKIDNRKRRHQRIEEQEGAEPFNPWDDGGEYPLFTIDVETDLDIPVGTGYWSDEELSEAINNYNDPYYDPYDCNEYPDDDYYENWEEWEVDEDDDGEAILIDPEVSATMVENLQKQCRELEEYNNRLEDEIRKLHEFLSDFNLETLHNYWENHK